MAIEPALNETITVGFVTSSAAGGAVDADALPTVQVFAGANDAAVSTPTVTKRAGKTGVYRSTIALTAANGFAVGACYEIFGNATVGGQAASALLDRFILRAYTVDGTNVKDVANQPATLLTGGMTLTPAERIAIAAAVKVDVGNDTVTGSLGQQSKDMAATMAKYGGLMITGKVAAAPGPTQSAFDMTLDDPLASGKTAAGIIGQYCTLRSGGAQTEGNPITTCVINSPTSLSLTFGGTSVFSAAPVADDTVSISE